MTASKNHHQNEHENENAAYHHDVQTYIEWHAPGRPFEEHSREYYVNGLLIMVALEIIIFFFSRFPQDLPLLMLVPSLAFLSFALSYVRPHDFYYKITSEGVRVEDYFFIWDELYDFFFMEHHGKQVLYLTTKSFYSGELKLTLGEISVDEIKQILLPYLPYREYVKPTFMEKSGNWLSKNFPLEKVKK